MSNIKVTFSLVILSLSILLSGYIWTETSAYKQNRIPASMQTPLTISESNLKIGEIIKLPDMEAAVTEANKTDYISYSLGGRNINEMAGEGNVLITADFWIKNTGNKTIRFTNIPFTLRDNAGFKYSPLLYAGYDGIGLLNDSYPGQIKRGRAVFRVPVEAHGFNFYLDTKSFSGPDFSSLPINVESISWWPGR